MSMAIETNGLQFCHVIEWNRGSAYMHIYIALAMTTCIKRIARVNPLPSPLYFHNKSTLGGLHHS